MCDLCDMEEEEKDDDDEDEIGKENGDPRAAMSMSKLGARGDVGGVKCFKCMLRDMSETTGRRRENRLVNCTFANFGCRWRGSFRRLSAHASQCRVRPRLCPNGCGAKVSVGPMMKRHLDMCPMGEVACDAPDAEADLAICRPVENAGEGDVAGALVTVLGNTRSWPRSAPPWFDAWILSDTGWNTASLLAPPSAESVTS